MNNITDELNKIFKDAPGMENITATIKAVSPTKVFKVLDINNQEDPYHIIGAALLINGFGERVELACGDLVYSVPAIADIETLKKLDNDCIFYITDHQKLEALNIVDGALTLLVNNNVIKQELAYKILNDIVMMNNFKGLFYKFIDIPSINDLESISKELSEKNNSKAYERIINTIIDILIYIWFIPYGELDKIYNDFVAQYNESKSTEENK